MERFFENKIFANLSLLLTAMIWGYGFIGVRIAGDAGMSAELMLVCRFAISSVLLLLIYRKKVLAYTKTELIYGVITGVFLFLPFYFQTLGMRFTSNSNSAFLTALYVLAVPFLEWLAFRKRPTIRIFICSVLAMAGVGILTGAGSAFSLNLGDWLVFLSSLLFAAHIVCIGLAAKKCSVEKLLFLQIAVAGVLGLVSYAVSLFTSGQGAVNWPSALPAVLFLGIFSTTLTYFIQTSAQRFASPSAVTIFLSTEALFATTFSVLLGYEGLTVSLAAGGALMMFAVIAVDLRLSKKKA